VGIAGDLRIWLLGGFRVELDGRPVTDEAWRRNRARALVKLLALAPDHRLHREQLMDGLWPDLDADAEAANLRKAIHFARQALTPGIIVTRGGVVSLEAGTLWIDVNAFESLARSGAPAAALELYRGELLPEDRFEPWTGDVRERLRSIWHRLLLDVAEDTERGGDLEAATVLLERLLASDPLHEEGALALMRVHASSGARHLALRRYRQVEEALRDELGVEPGEAIRDLHEAIVGGRYPVAAGPSEPSAPVPMPEEERRLVTVLWADPLLAAGDPELGRDRLTAWTKLVTEVVEGWDGSADPQAGGSVVAVFGVPRAHEDDPARALRAGLEIIEGTPLPTRLGIATGEVIAAMGAGSGTRLVAGDVVASAGRLREAAEFGAVLVAGRTRRAAGWSFRYADDGAVKAGTDGPDGSEARRLVGEVRDARARAADEPPFVGRDSELQGVLGLLDETIRTGRSRLLTLVGSAGVGKSRLVAEVVAALTGRHPEVRVLQARCLSGGRDSVYWPLGEILRSACGISLDDSAEGVQTKLRQRIAAHLDGDDPEDIEATIFALAMTAGISLPGNPLDGLPPDDVAQRLGLAWPRCVSAFAAQSPTLVVLEDLHWAAPELLDMAEQIVLRSSGPLLILGTARPELRDARPTFGMGGDDSTIAIRPLSDDQSETLLDSLLASDPLDTRLRDQLLARAEGNPFYLEQLTRHVRGEGGATLPDTLQSLLAARLDSLALPERRVLQEAAVVGRVFWATPLRRAVADERADARLAALERAGFVLRRPTSSIAGQAEYTFRHALLHDVAYESLPRGRRARAHAAVGAWIEEIAGERVAEVAELLAHHFAAAVAPGVAELAWEDPDARETARLKAVQYLLRAGDAAHQRFAIDRAVLLHRRLLEISLGRNERLRALEALADDHESSYHGDEAAAMYREAIELARDSPAHADDLARLCRKLGWMMAWNPGAFRTSPDPADVDALVAEGSAAARDEAELAWFRLVHGAAARLYRGSEPFGQGTRPDPRPIEARIGAVEEARAKGRELGRDDLVLAGDVALGMLLGVAGRYSDMLELSRSQVASLGPGDSRLDRADAIRKLAVHLITVNADFEQGLELGLQSRTLTQGGSPHQAMHASWPILVALFHLGRLDELLPILDEQIAAFRTEPAIECQFVRDGPAIGAAVLTLLGRDDEARAIAELLGSPLADRSSASAWQSRLATLSGDPATARVISEDKAREGRTYGPQHTFALLEALAALADWDAVLAFLTEARSAVAGNALLGPMADRVEGQAALAAGDRERGELLLRRSSAAFHKLGAVFEASRSDALL
jgi:DNA-binding SARP family transcriptional activator